MANIVCEPMSENDIKLLYETVRIAHKSLERGCYPFGALLADSDNNILIRKGNNILNSTVLHAELLVMIEAGRRYSPLYLKSCTLYSSFAPCIMCTATASLTNIGRIVYGCSSDKLLELQSKAKKKPSYSLSSNDVLDKSQKDILIVGPTQNEELIEAILKDHINFWK